MKVVLATNNAKKLAELRRILTAAAADEDRSDAARGIEVLGLADVPAYPEPAETESTFEGNALLKARACVHATGLPAPGRRLRAGRRRAQRHARCALGTMGRTAGQ